MRYLRVYKGIQLLRAIDLYMGNKRKWVGEIEVFAWWRAVLLGHCVKELYVITGLKLD